MRKAFILLVKGSLLFFILLLSSGAKGISVTANLVGTLPGVLVESSALNYAGESHFWSLNDSGEPNIYCIAEDGSLNKKIVVSNALNRNWEDMTHDISRNYMFIGDFGNNNNDRTNLRVFRISYPTSLTGSEVLADQINFTYPDQTQFPSNWWNFDVESFFHFQGKLYLFTKADGAAIGYTKMYSIPDSPGSYVATLVDSFYTNDRTTSADISPDGTSVILISNTRIHIFRNFTGTDFFGGQHTMLSIAGGWTQKEGVSFSTNNEIYLTDENTGTGNFLYYINLSAWIPPPQINTSIEKVNISSVSVYPVPANEFVKVMLKNVNAGNIIFSLYDLTGKNIYETKIENPLIPFIIRTEDYASGIYFYKVSADAKDVQTSRIFINH